MRDLQRFLFHQGVPGQGLSVRSGQSPAILGKGGTFLELFHEVQQHKVVLA